MLPAMYIKNEMCLCLFRCLLYNPIRVISAPWMVLCPKMGEVIDGGLVHCVGQAHKEGFMDQF